MRLKSRRDRDLGSAKKRYEGKKLELETRKLEDDLKHGNKRVLIPVVCTILGISGTYITTRLAKGDPPSSLPLPSPTVSATTAPAPAPTPPPVEPPCRSTQVAIFDIPHGGPRGRIRTVDGCICNDGQAIKNLPLEVFADVSGEVLLVTTVDAKDPVWKKFDLDLSRSKSDTVGLVTKSKDFGKLVAAWGSDPKNWTGAVTDTKGMIRLSSPLRGFGNGVGEDVDPGTSTLVPGPTNSTPMVRPPPPRTCNQFKNGRVAQIAQPVLARCLKRNNWTERTAQMRLSCVAGKSSTTVTVTGSTGNSEVDACVVASLARRGASELGVPEGCPFPLSPAWTDQ